MYQGFVFSVDEASFWFEKGLRVPMFREITENSVL